MSTEKKPKTVATTVLNIAPLPTPINPYEFGYRYLAASRQDTDTPATRAAIEERMKYMRWLQVKMPPLETNEPIICLALMRGALDHKARAYLLAALTTQAEDIPKLAAAAKAKAPAVKPDQVIEHPPALVDELAAAKKRIAELEATTFKHPEPRPPAVVEKPAKKKAAAPAPDEGATS